MHRSTQTPPSATPATARASRGLRGTGHVSGDKSISHRALMIASQQLGRTSIDNLLESDDIFASLGALRQLGVSITHEAGTGRWHVEGRGIGGLQAPEDVLDMGNAGTAIRLMAGLLAPYPYLCLFTGDASLRTRPMGRVMTPLQQMGARFMTTPDHTPPFAMYGTDTPLAISYTLPVASAQVKSAVMLAALNTPGLTTVIEPAPTRDHTERMFQAAGFPLTIHHQEDGRHIAVTGCPAQTYQDRALRVPGDPSSAAFLAVAALITPDAAITLPGIGMNETRLGLFHTLTRMGARLQWEQQEAMFGEPVGCLRVESSELHGVEVPAASAPSMIDEYPILAIAAAFARGTSVFRGLGELRHKESDRFDAIITGLCACGVVAYAEGDDIHIHGNPQSVPGEAIISTRLDHRIAMSFLIMGLASNAPVAVDNIGAIHTSFPEFIATLKALGAHIETGVAAPSPPRAPTGENAASIGPNPRPPGSELPTALSQPLLVTIDGPAASGKGTLSRMLADYFGIPHLDTGGLYRAASLRLLNQGGNPYNEGDACQAARAISAYDLSNPRLREEQVGNIASIISAKPEVRQILLDFQRDFANQRPGAILDGRDIGTVVCPEAPFKFFITASLETRATRRHCQLQEQGIEVVYSSVLNDLKERDHRDCARNAAPLVAADDAVTLDTTHMAIHEVFQYAVTHVLEGASASRALAQTS